MQFRILGTVGVVVDGRLHPVPGLRQRSLLASLLLQAPGVVPVQQLFTELWGENPPTAVENALQAHVSRLRRTLTKAAGREAGARALVTHAAGYSVDVVPEDIDLTRFRSGIRQSHRLMEENDLTGARQLLEGALALWQGTPLGDAAIGPLCASAATQIEEEYLSALEDAYYLRIRSGEPVRVVGDLKRMTIAHPWRERITELLMVALYQSGRQAEAVGVYNAARRRLVDELGMEPSPKLRQLFRQMLNQDPGLHRSGALLRQLA
ncbi:AfsR/SARP family transcriptional regulator [Actinacidiphila guanduensis]|uniref:DNA-binding transcriptional activator of the SARP family n=1 Tax=Actinacidiphila guanduensis TaxID=310781 RepID=A0A1H0IZH3_9ACTN|nr:AfsR/SARP family transcriptional regulator [Actinacidiphila guanduensis]SDO36723.1 DNA-binding transcriptional activator of the SARP family [Actinacidiphila guanduensis]